LLTKNRAALPKATATPSRPAAMWRSCARCEPRPATFLGRPATPSRSRSAELPHAKYKSFALFASQSNRICCTQLPSCFGKLRRWACERSV
jgi:hypothetical protein